MPMSQRSDSAAVQFQWLVHVKMTLHDHFDELNDRFCNKLTDAQMPIAARPAVSRKCKTINPDARIAVVLDLYQLMHNTG